MAEFRITMAAARVNAGLTQSQIAEKMHVNKATVVGWEKGRVAPKPAYFKLYCEICKIPTEYVLVPKYLTDC